MENSPKGKKMNISLPLVFCVWALGTAMVKVPEARQIYLDDVINSVGQTFLSTTMRCFKCHDHKFDPLPHAIITRCTRHSQALKWRRDLHLF